MKVFTGTVYGKHTDAVDITVKSGLRAFAPTWDMVMGFKEGRISEADYTEQYLAMMRKSYRENRSAWEALLKRDSVTLVCYCKAGAFCHRHLLASILVKLGAQMGGER